MNNKFGALKAISVVLATLMVSSGAIADNKENNQGQGTQNVIVTNPATNPVQVKVTNTPLPVSGSVGITGTVPVSGSVGITGTPSVNIANTPTVNVGNSIKPSQLVKSISSSNCSSPLADHQSFDVNIPAGMVLVAKRVLALFNVAASTPVQLIIRRNDDPTGFDDIGGWLGSSDENGNVAHEFDFSSGVVVRSGTQVCFIAIVNGNNAVAASLFLYGYLANDE